MKTLLFFLPLLFAMVNNPSESKLPSIKLSHDGRCSGNAYCTACSNCRYCGHCNSGGTCGVCASYSAPVRTIKKKSQKKTRTYSSSNYYSSPSNNSYSNSIDYKSPESYSYEDLMIVTSKILNVRKGPGIEYEIIETLNQGDALTFLSYEGEWIQVRVYDSGKEGYVNYKFVR